MRTRKSMLNAAEALRLGLDYHRAGRLDKAADVYRQILEAFPRDADAHGLLGLVEYERGALDDAERLVTRALALASGHPQHLQTLGNVRRAQGRPAEAADAYAEAARRAPGVPEIHFSLGLVLKETGEPDLALAALDAALRLRPQYADAHAQRGEALGDLGRLDEAVSAFERALALAPAAAPVRLALGTALGQLGRHKEALRELELVAALDPGQPAAHFNVGVALVELGLCNEAVAHLERARELAPDDGEIHSRLGGSLYNAGRPTEAAAAFRAAVERSPGSPKVFSNYLLSLNYEAGEAAALAAEHRRYGAMAEALAGPALARPRAPDPARRLRIGYVSPDFRGHSVSYFIAPVLERHDRARCEVWCYYTHATHDRTTERLKGYADRWADVHLLADEALARRIAADEIDVLVDLAGHTGGSRLMAFARRPAPVQITFLGYPDATGLAAIGHRITDARVDPRDDAAGEAPLRLPASYFCFRPGDAPPVREPPARAAGRVTFGSFNNLAKVSERTLDLWSAVLRAVDGAQLLLKAHALADLTTRARTLDRLGRRGIDPARVSFLGWQHEVGSHLETYHRVDVGLDCFPYNGATTTCQALWMGVPVVSRVGATRAARMGLSILSAAGLGELAVESDEAFVARAAALAGDLDALAALRAGMRDRLARSALMDEVGYTRALEDAYRSAWTAWCRAQAPRDLAAASPA